MQSGFLKASKILMNYFKSKNDDEFYNYSKLKNKELVDIYIISFEEKIKRLLLLFIPPILLVLKKKFFRK